MLKLVGLVSVQSIFLVASQIFLKMALASFGTFEWTLRYFKNVFTNIPFALSGISIAVASLLWVYILKHFEFSVAYPLISISYIFGLLAAYFIFHENIPATRWLGAFIIVIGVYFITKK
ncbi:hypothetical protein CYCD_17250 [Tenuifilaceae bacterium CYCD]|nr:hypothetical protein CYCD_17250 [Tenuifilaceae bacterium CYCD]